MLSLDPPLKLPTPPKLNLESQEDPSVLAFVEDWEKTLHASLSAKHPGRVIQATCLDLTGLRTLLPRYIAPQLPPAEIYAPAATAEAQ